MFYVYFIINITCDTHNRTTKLKQPMSVNDMRYTPLSLI